jgi:hypothetical protein
MTVTENRVELDCYWMEFYFLLFLPPFFPPSTLLLCSRYCAIYLGTTWVLLHSIQHSTFLLSRHFLPSQPPLDPRSHPTLLSILLILCSSRIEIL